MKILSFDQSSLRNGYAILEGNRVLKSGSFSLGSEDLHYRLVAFREVLKKFIKEEEPDVVVFEDIQLQHGNVQVYRALASILAVAEELCVEMNQPYQVMSSSTWRSILEFKSKTRDAAKEEAKKRTGCTSSDEADAICIGMAYYQKSVGWYF